MAATTVAPPSTRTGLFARPQSETGFWSWFTTVDHKKIGLMYGATALVYFVIGGLEATVLRVQLFNAEANVITEEAYNQLFTMHGVTMVFLVGMPMAAAFFNYLIPLQIGARDVAFPRLNAFAYWVYFFGGLFIYSSLFIGDGGLPNGGWFGYAPLSTSSPGLNMAFYAVGLQMLGVGSLAGSINFITTIVNMRAPGMTLMRMPMFIWMALVTSFLMLFAMPIFAVALFMLQFDVVFGTQFFQAASGGDPILWQHLFWLFGHPEVYILILPAFGLVSEILPVFSRKPLFGYAAVAFAGAAIGFLGFGVWAHHMFTTGLGPVANSAFGLATMFIAVPTGIKIFNWVFTMWGGRLRFTTAMLFSVGLVAMFTIGGLSGVTHAIVPHDTQQTDTYYVVAHFHYVLFGGLIFGLFAGFYYYWPKVFGKLLDERLGKWNFWLTFVGFNLTFGPMHLSGLLGQPRRTAVLPEELGSSVEFYNQLSTYGTFVIIAAVALFLVNVVVTARSDERAPDDPWDARTLEWLTASPPKHYNFETIPTVTARDEFWHRKYAEDESGRAIRIPAGGSADVAVGGGGADTAVVDHGGADRPGGDDDHGHDIHMPDPSYWPLVMTAGMPITGYGIVLFNDGPIGPLMVVVGVLWMIFGMFAWINEPVAEDEH